MKQTIKKIKISNFQLSAPINERVRFAFVSDLHDCPFELIIKKLGNCTPNAILVGGDFIHNNEMYQNSVEFLKKAAKICPVFCSVGNHENRYKGNLNQLVNQTGAILLDNRYIEFCGVYIAGFSSEHDGDVIKGLMYSSVPDTDFLASFDKLKGYKVLICHHPEYYIRYVKRTSVDLILSGHAHGGQWRFFGRGVLAPGQGLFPKYTSGIHDGRFIISRGLGNPRIVPRINNRPEIVVIDLVPKA